MDILGWCHCLRFVLLAGDTLSPVAVVSNLVSIMPMS